MLVGGDKRARYRTWLGSRTGGSTWWWARVRRCSRRWRTSVPSSSLGRAIRRIARIARRTTTSAMWRWSGPARRSGVRALRVVPIVRGERARRRRGRAVDAAVAAGGGGARRSGGASPATGPRAPGDASRLHLRAAARLRDGAGLPLLRSARGVCGVRRSAPLEEGTVRCIVCEAPGRCAHCGAADFGLRRGGAERVEEWASTFAPVPVRRVATRGKARLPKEKEILVGGPESVRDLGPGDLELVAILDADMAERRPGLASANARWRRGWRRSDGLGRPAGRSCRPTARAIPPSRRWCAATRIGSTRTRRRGARRRGSRSGRRLPGRRFGCARSPSRGRRSHHDARLVRRRADGMLARARARSRGGVRSHDPRLAARDVVERVEAEPHL